MLEDIQKDVRTISVISPRPLNETGYFSLPGLMKKVSDIPTPIFYAIGTEDRNFVLVRAYTIHKILLEKQKNVVLKEYSFDRKWFWTPAHEYMNDIFDFISANSK